MVTVERAGRTHIAGLVALFEACGSSCFCRYWHFDGDKNAWLERCAVAPDENRRELEGDLRSDEPRGRGLVALHDERVIGWAKLAPRAALPKLRALPVYRALDLGADGGVLSIACFLVDPGWRGKGVGRALAGGAMEVGRGEGASIVEGYPIRAELPLRPDEVWRGTTGLFASAGYAEVEARTGNRLPWVTEPTALYPIVRARL